MKTVNVCLVGFVFVVCAWAEPLLEGRVRLESGEPVADAQVRLFDMTDLQQGAIARAQTDGTGYFALPLAALRGSALPEGFTLGPNYPNPFNPSTIIPYQLAASSAVRLEVFNLLGQRIATLVDGERPAGFHTATWHATDAANRAVGAGVYIYRMTVGVESQTGRMVLLDGQAGVSAAGASSVMLSASGVGGSDGEGAQMYGLVVSGSGLVPYVDSSFRVEAGMASVELVVSAGQHPAGKVADDDCPLCDFFDAFNDAAKEKEKGPDLIVQSLSVSDTTLTLGQEFTLNVTVHNQGDEQAAATMLHYYRSNNATITSSDTEVGTDAVDTLASLATSAQSIALTAPTSAGEGIYFYGACVASVSGESNTGNNCSSAVKITVKGQVATEESDETLEEEGSDTPVTIPDANLRAAIEAALGKARGATITKAEMETLTELPVPGADISDLTGLEFAVNLTYLNTQYNFDITDLSPLAGLTNLKTFALGCNSHTDISFLSGLTNLTDLNVGGNGFTDISFLSGLTNLTRLHLGNNDITDISPVAGLINLTELGLLGNDITDISPLAGLTNLTRLVLLGNDITDISPLAGLIKLAYLDLRENSIRDISSLSGLSNLTSRYFTLWLGNNDIRDISSLSGLTSPIRLSLRLENNNIRDISPLSGLTNLTDLDVGGNDIRDISSLSGLTNLRDLRLGFNSIRDISLQAGLTSLTFLDLKFNSIRDISSLSGLSNQTILDLRGNPLSDSSINDHIADLESSGVRVLFDLLRKGDFDIELVFVDDVSELQKNVIQYTAKRWMSVIVEDLPDYTFAQGFSGTCGGQSYEIPSGERIDDLRIYVSTYVSSNIAIGEGSPHILRETTHLPVVGCMAIDVSNTTSLLGTPLHEIGHVLGFGTLWEEFGLRQDLSYSDWNADTHFNGPRAIAAFDDAGGRDYRGKKVPVERRDGVHWRFGVLNGEIMTPARAGEEALSAITVQSLADLGYGVDVTRADPYNTREPYDYLSGTTASAKISAALSSTPTLSNVHALPTLPQLSCGVGEQREPIYVVDEQGYIIRTLGD